MKKVLALFIKRKAIILRIWGRCCAGRAAASAVREKWAHFGAHFDNPNRSHFRIHQVEYACKKLS